MDSTSNTFTQAEKAQLWELAFKQDIPPQQAYRLSTRSAPQDRWAGVHLLHPSGQCQDTSYGTAE